MALGGSRRGRTRRVGRHGRVAVRWAETAAMAQGGGGGRRADGLRARGLGHECEEMDLFFFVTLLR
jgi:hypothetical protein